MKFRDAVTDVPQLRGAYRSGLQALRAVDRDRIRCSQPRRLAGSVGLDGALAEPHPNDPRWDYGIGHKDGRAEAAIWIEIHPASSNHVTDMIRKVAWLKQWLRANAAKLMGLTRKNNGYVWLATGSVSLQPGSRQAKQLALAGISLPRRRLDLS